MTYLIITVLRISNRTGSSGLIWDQLEVHVITEESSGRLTQPCRKDTADRRGRVPESPWIWGWRRKPAGRGWVPQGTRIGWVARSDLFLESAASYHVAQQAAGVERIPVSEQTLRHRLRERGLLASIDASRQMLLVRRTLEGCPRQVLHLNASELVGP